MPLYRKFQSGDSIIAIWKIEEDLSFFDVSLPAGADINHENKRLQWYASRYLVKNVLGVDAEVDKNEYGKPVIRNSSSHLSISHTPFFAAVMVNPSKPVGIDIEALTPKVVRIAYKFLREDEIQAIREDERIEKLILYWSAKEALFKFYAKGGIEFKSRLLIEPFELKEYGTLNAAIVVPGERIEDLQVNYEFFEGHVLTYVAETRYPI